MLLSNSTDIVSQNSFQHFLLMNLAIPFQLNTLLTCRGEREDQEMEEQGELQHDVEARTTWWGYS